MILQGVGEPLPTTIWHRLHQVSYEISSDLVPLNLPEDLTIPICRFLRIGGRIAWER